MIVSVNGRERKIAIIEDGKTTEFYIERGEDNQGIVGNIYKGRVMRVLPGMQSAFVNIGLERDGFLYVSDFFDEEEEFERIATDKVKVPSTERLVTEQARAELELRIEEAQERAEPLGATSELPEAARSQHRAAQRGVDLKPTRVPTGAPTRAKETAVPAPQASTRTSSRTRSDRARADRRTDGADGIERRAGERAGIDSSIDLSEDKTALPIDSPINDALARTIEFDTETPFVSTTADFQRIIDEENAAGEGEMLKDAMIQERILDQIHAIEFDLEEPRQIEVGSLLSINSVADETGFERVEDGFNPEANEQEDECLSGITFTRVNAQVDEIEPEVTSKPKALFERVSDEEFEKPEVIPQKKPGRSQRRRKESGKESSKETGDEEVATPKRTRGANRTPGRSSSRGSGRNKNIVEPESVPHASTEPASFSASSSEVTETRIKNPDMDESYADAEASIDSPAPRAEFARRGGRRRRRASAPNEGGTNTTTATNATEGTASADNDKGVRDLSVADVTTDLFAAETLTDETEETDVASTIKSKPARRSSAARSGRGQSSNGSRRDTTERGSVAITDLLREGQEILVQIAKEPISSKGARITSHIALPGRHLVYMPTVEHVGVSRKIESDSERIRLRKLIQIIREEEDVPSGGFIVRTAGVGISEKDLRDDARYLVRTWLEIKRKAEKAKAPALLHRDLDLVQRILRDNISDEFAAIRVDSEDEYLCIVEFINRVQPALIKRVKLYTRDTPILEAYGVQDEIDKAVKPRVWLHSGGYLVINQTEALVAIDVNTGKFVGRGGRRLEDTITRTNIEAVEEIARQIRLRDLGGIIVLDLIDMIERRNRQKVMQVLQEALQKDKSPTKVLAFNDFGLVIMTRKRVKQSLERTLCSPCPTCQGSGLVKSPQTICYEVLEEARHLARGMANEGIKQTTLRVSPEVAQTLRGSERDVLSEIEDYLGVVDITSDALAHQEQFDFAFT